MVEKIRHYIEGIGSVLDIYPTDRDLSVSSHTAPTEADAFNQDMKAIGGDFQRVLQKELGHGKEAE